MEIRRFRHKGVRRLYELDDPTGLPPASVPKLRHMLAFLDAMRTPDELRTLPGWRAHQLTGDRKGTWALHVTKNWRLTFLVSDGFVDDVDFEDYH